VSGKKTLIHCLAALVFLASPTASLAGDWDLRGDASVEIRIFPEDPLFPDQENTYVSPSLKLEPEVGYEWNDGSDRIIFKPFIRVDKDDDNRTHSDVRELNWFHQANNWPSFSS